MQKHLKTILTFFCLLCTLLILTPAARAQETGEQNRSQKVLSSFPEKTVFMTVIPNAPDLKKKITSHRLADAVKNQEVRAFLRPLLEKKNLQNWLKSVRTVTGHSLDQLTDMVTGPVAAGLLDGKKGMFSEGSDQGPAAKVQGLLIAQVDGHESTLSDEIIPALVEKWKKKLRKKGDKELFEKTEPMGDTTLHTFLKRSDGESTEAFSWAIAGGYFVAVSPKSKTLLKNTVRRMTGDRGGSSITDVDNFRASRRKTENAELYMYSNLRRIIDAGFQKSKRSYREQEKKRGPSPEDVWRVLGLDTIQSAVATVNLKPDSTEVNAQLSYTERTGLTELLAFKQLSPDREDLLSLPPSIVSGTAWGFSMKSMWERTMSALKELNSTMAGMLTMQMGTLKKKFGLDLKKDIVNALGDRILAVNFPPSEESDADDESSMKEARQMWAIQVTDTDRLKSALKSLKDGIEKGKKYFSTRSYLGTTIYSVSKNLSTPMVGSISPSYAFVDGYMIISMHEKVIEDTIAHLNRDGTSGFFEKKKVRRAFDRLPDEAASLGYTNLKSVLSFFVDQLGSMAAVPGGNDIEEYVDLEAGLSPEVIGQYIQSIVGALYVNDQGMKFLWRLQHAKK